MTGYLLAGASLCLIVIVRMLRVQEEGGGNIAFGRDLLAFAAVAMAYPAAILIALNWLGPL